MPIETHSFTKTPVNQPQLKEEILQNCSGMPYAVVSMWTSGDTLYITTKEELTTEQLAALTATVDAHVAHPLASTDITNVKIREEPDYMVGTIDRTFQTQSFEMDPIVTGGLHTKTISFPYDIVLLGGEFRVKAENVGDRCELVVHPNRVAADLGVALDVGATTFIIPEEAQNYIFKGYKVRLDNGTNQDDLGRVVKVVGNVAYVENATTRTWAAEGDTEIISEYYMIPHLYFDAEFPVDIGRDSASGTYLPAGELLVFRYYNDTGSPKQKKVSLRIGYYF
jgi:hypothetical protein